jgi:hypothetical protein
MQTKLPEIQAADLKAVRDFLIGVTDEVRFPSAEKPRRQSDRSRAAVPVHNGIVRARTRSARLAD